MRKLCVVLFALAAWACGCEKLEVSVVIVDRGAVESTVTSVEAGVVEPLRKASLASPVSGRIVRVNREEGDPVKAGEALVELENDIEKLRVDETARDLERLKQMKDDVASAEQIDRADFAHRRALVEYERTYIRSTFNGSVVDVNARVGEMTFGSMALALGAGKNGQEPLVYVVDNSKLFVKAEIDESDVFRVKPGQSVKVTLGGIDRATLSATVSSISPAVSTREGESRTAEVKAEIDKGDCPVPAGGPRSGPERLPADGSRQPIVLVGMSADLEILVGRVEGVVRIPTTTILERGEEKYVFTVRGGKLERQPITVGLGNWDMTEVRSGLGGGEQVVVPTDLKLLSAGREVKAVEDAARPRLVEAEPMIELEHVSRVYAAGGRGGLAVEVAALRDVQIRIESGEFVAVTGASGSGKSTLLNILGCLDRPTHGVYRLDGEAVSGLSDAALARVRNKQIGFVFQSYNLLPRQTAVDNVALPLIYSGVGRRERRRRASLALEQLQLKDRAHHRPNQLSGGQSQRVAIARALIQNPSILLADEPTGNLDSRAGHEVLEVFHELNRERGVTIVLVTHDVAVAATARRQIRLGDGRVTEDSGAPGGGAIGGA